MGQRRLSLTLTLVALLLAACATPPPTGSSFSIVATPTATTTLADETLDLSVTLTGSPGGTVILDISNLAPGMSAPTPVTLADGTVSGQLSLVVGPDVALGDSTVTVTAVGPDASATADVTVTVDPTPGSVDSSYGDDGRAVFPRSVGSDVIVDVALDADGNAVVIYSADNGDDSDFGVARVLPDGTLDPTFGTDGFATFDGGSNDYDYPSSLAIAGDGDILIGGVGRGVASVNDDLMVMRLDSDGALDPAFGAGGIAVADIGSGEVGGAIAIDSAGNIVVVGGTSCCSGSDILVARFDSAGNPDAGFDGDGLLVLDLGATGDDEARGVAIDDSDRIVVVGSGEGPASTDEDLVVMRLTTSGAFDGTFNGGAPVIRDIDGSEDELQAVAIDAANRIVAVGYSGIGGGVNEDTLTIRLDGSGGFDNGFGSDGIVTTDVTGTYDLMTNLALAPDGDILAVGVSFAGRMFQSAFILRYDGDGRLDSDFNKDGLLPFDIALPTVAVAAVIDGDGSYLIAGFDLGPMLLKIDPTP
jgi:uncharacterized delta-60 repeat protein